MIDRLVSVIIPIYNNEMFIERCVKSVSNQSYSNIEIILVDDGSEDNSFSICNELAKNDNRIRVFHTINQGVSAARNYGIEKARGDFYMFIDSDDVVNEHIVEILLNDIESEKCDIASCRLEKVINEDELIRKTQVSIIPQKCFVRNFDGALEHLVVGNLISACCRLYRAETVKGIRFPTDYKYNEDKYYVYLCLCRGNRFAYREERLYIQHFRRNSSSKNGIYSQDTIKISSLIASDIARNHVHLLLLAYKNDLLTCRNNLHQLFEKRVSDPGKKNYYFKELRQRILSVDSRVWKEEALQYKIEKVFIRLGYLSYKLFYSLWSRVKKHEK